MPVTYPFFTANESAKETAAYLVIHGTFLDAPTPQDLRIRREHLAVVNIETGKFEYLGPRCAKSIYEDLRAVAAYACNNYDLLVLKPSQLIAVGLVDCHIHAPQFTQLGTKTDIPLMQWLDKYTFPAESRFSSPDHAAEVYPQLLRRLLRTATTTAMYFATNHLEATKILAETAASHGQRALIGKVCSDQLLPEYYVEKTENSIAETEEFILWCYETFGDTVDALIKPVVTPRFVPTCSPELLHGLGELVQKYPNVHVQTHAAESVDEVLLVKSQQRDEGCRDVAILERSNLMTENMVLVHCCHLNPDERVVLQKAGVGIVSCPWSNMLFAREVVPIAQWYNSDIEGQSDVDASDSKLEKVGLGTDIAGGPSSSMWSAVRLCVIQDRIRSYHNVSELGSSLTDSIPREEWLMTPTFAYHIATVGGARTLGLDDLIGTWEIGKAFDGCLVDFGLEESQSGFDVCPPPETTAGEAKWEEWTKDGWEKFIMGGDDRNILKVWVNGKEVCAQE